MNSAPPAAETRGANARIGPFTLVEPIGRGAIGTVWRATHRRTRRVVAIKVWSGAEDWAERRSRAFASEVRAMAALDHPNIVPVLDFGEVQPSDHGPFPAGRPYLVMELIEGGSLEGAGRVGSWRALRTILADLLAALGHAHARGVVHRDLKPSNVLRGTRGHVRLTDFGLARGRDDDADEDGAAGPAGTPAFMAPEQCHGRWRDCGPWTDLYALGCLTHALVHGASPFEEPSAFRTLEAQLTRPPPPPRAEFPLPEGFSDWVERLLEKKPADRFERAPDAAFALSLLEEPAEPVAAPWLPPTDTDPATPSRITVPWPGLDAALETAAGAPSGAIVEWGQALEPMMEGIGRNVSPPPFPGDWRTATAAAPIEPDGGRAEPRGNTGPLFAQAAGSLALATRRAIPLVGRESERDHLWRRLGEVVQTGLPRAVLLRGPPGIGKSRLAEWLCAEAHAVGAATPLRAQHSASSGTADGLGPMLLRHLRGFGAPRSEVAARAATLLESSAGGDREAVAALTEVISPSPIELSRDDAGPLFRLSSPLERYLALAGALRALARSRPVIVVIDDAQWGVDALQTARLILDRAEVPALIVIAAREDLLSDRPLETRLLTALTELPGVTSLPLAPLADAEHRALVRLLAPLAPSLARRVEALTAGHPLFGVQLVRDLIERGLLVGGDDGELRLRGGAEAVAFASEDLRALWRERVRRFVDKRPDDDVRALEIASALGAEVDDAEWGAACEAARAYFSPALREELLRSGLAEPRSTDGDDEGWRFAHGTLRDAVEAEARAAGRWDATHATLAEVLNAREAPPGRVGDHWLAADRPREALGSYAAATRALLAYGRYPEAEQTLDGWEVALERAAPPPDDPLRTEGWLLRAGLAQGRGDFAAARDAATRAAARARTTGDVTRHVEALLCLGRLDHSAGDRARGLDHARLADQLLSRLDDPALRGECDRLLARILNAAGRHAESRRRAATARAHFERAGQPVAAAHCLVTEGTAAKQAGAFDDAARLIEDARRRFRECGSRLGEADCMHDLGELARLRGNLRRAEECYRQAGQIYEAIGSGHVVYISVNRALVMLERGDAAGAAALISAALPAIDAQGRELVSLGARCVRMAAFGRIGEWGRVLQDLAVVERALTDEEVFELDLARCLHFTAESAERLGHPGEAAHLWTLCARQWDGLQRPDAAAEARVRISSLTEDGA